jgi:hypothetical protein
VPLGGANVTLTVVGLPPSGTTIAIAGLSVIDLPFKGGTLVPAPDLLVVGLPVVLGRCSLDFTFPPAVPSGTVAAIQFWTADPGAPLGLSASNGLELTVP